MACIATATRTIKADIMSSLEVRDCITVSIPPNRSNIKYIVWRWTTVEEDLVSSLKAKLINTPRVIVYCRTLLLIADLFDHFSAELEGHQFYPPGAPDLCKNRLFGIFHSKTPESSKEVITKSLLDPRGVV